MIRTHDLPFVSEDTLRERLVERGLFLPDVQRAMAQAALSHSGQDRDSGRPYLGEHILPVADGLLLYYDNGGEIGDPEVTVITALLHDTIEDDKTFSHQKCSRMFGKEIADMVWRLSKITGESISYEDKLMDEATPDTVRLVKSADRDNNLNSSIALNSSTDPRPCDRQKMEKYIGETERFYIPLADTLPDRIYFDRLTATVKLARRVLNPVA